MKQRRRYSRTADAAASAAVDDYKQAQQRVRAILSAADATNPAATAEQLPNNVNELTIALQLLATAPRPTTLATYRQFTAAITQLAAAVLEKYKQLLLGSDHQAKLHDTGPKQQQLLLGPQQQQQQLAAALSALPPTRVAAVTFSLGVLRLYDKQLVLALEEASLNIMHRGGFKPNQLGQVVQGFVYLDHVLKPAWHARFQVSTGQLLHSMQAAQVASLAVWLLKYSLQDSSSATSTVDNGAAVVLGRSSLSRDAELLKDLAANASPATAGTGGAATSPAAAPAAYSFQTAPVPDAPWVQAYLTAAGRTAAAAKPLQLMQLIQAAAALYQHYLVQQQVLLQEEAVAGFRSASTGLSCNHCSSAVADIGGHLLLPAELAVLPVDVLPLAGSVQMTAMTSHQGAGGAAGQLQHDSSPSSSTVWHAADSHRHHHSSRAGSTGRARYDRQASSSGGRGAHGDQGAASEDSGAWAVQLVTALQQKLPELSMTHLAGLLPPLLLLTKRPWPAELLRPLLMQVQVLLPSSAGTDLVVVAQAAAHLAGPEALAANAAWCDAVLTQLHAQLPSLDPSGLAAAVYCVSLLHVRPYKAWQYELCQRLRIDTGAMSADEVLLVLEGLAGVRVQLDPEVLHAFVLQIQRWMGSYRREQLGRLVAALRLMYPRALPGRTVQHLVEEMQRRQQFLALQAQGHHHQQQLF